LRSVQGSLGESPEEELEVGGFVRKGLRGIVSVVVRRLLPGGSTVVLLGAGAAALVPEQAERLGVKRVLVLSTSRRMTAAERVSTLLGARSAGVLGIAEEHVPVEIAKWGRAEASRRTADALVAVGGGSTVGLAKAIALEQALPILALPTTFSGSEMTPVWGITEGGMKRTGRDERVRAACVLYDPELSLSLPAAVAVPSAFNALAHAVEALYAPEADAEVLGLAEEAVRALVTSLPVLAAGSPEIEPREQGFYGACLAGACLGKTSMGLHHKLCHVLGGTFGLPHALTHAVLLPYVARFNLEVADDARERLARALGARDPVQALFALGAKSGVPRDLASLGLPADALGRAAELATASPYPNPRALSTADVRGVLEAAYRGVDPSFTRGEGADSRS
jgi:maleylacetate reductase